MPSKAETRRRKALVNQVADRNRAEAAAKQPLSDAELDALFDHLDAALTQGCDHTLRFTREYLGGRSLAVERIVDWLHEHGGYCDCEVLANVDE